ncbi:hypothetical protein Q9R46_14500 [Paenibacillus sp. RRE4]|uniref:hypothetical protein n=1 Tax=Paenibacillus sp. RRE4 TaxID=2962587 RepID=UPI002881BCE4|nr:hypothetical protein [Paenibacillus sp. RRE4]MDT0123868.1 hypothetical protein [Paenibacillus sp. RRE4]
MKKMYPAVVNSPKTELPEAITSTQTDITVANVAVLLTGEGIATIGNGDTAETITYTSVDGNVLKGCIRGYQGVARSWTAGTRVARNFAAADWDAARDNITELADRLGTPERVSITLQPGVHVVNANQDAAFKLAGLQGKTLLNYQSQIGIYGVLNPYVIRYGTNLLPPFYEWVSSSNNRIDAPYDATITAASTTQEYMQYDLVPVSGQVYTITGANIRVVDLTNIVILAFTGNALSTQTFTVPPTCKIVRIVVSNATQATVGTGDIVTSPGTYRAINPMLNIGSTAKPFKPREDSMLALQTELHANPDTGANPDSVFERDGQYFKLAKWHKVLLDGSLNWIYVGNNSGAKTVGVNALADSGADIYRKTVMTKYNGSLIKSGEISDLPAGDAGYIYGNSFRLSIKSADSGWGDSYTPTADEIKAYFMGWVMSQHESWSTEPSRYNGTGTKGWFRRYTGTGSPVNTSQLGIIDGSSGTTTLPTTPAPNWTPYQLLYQLATPVVEPITSEGQLTFVEGDNQIEVGTGIVLRESVKPTLLTPDNNYYINSQAAATKLAYKVSKFMNIYANSRQVYDWSISTNADSWGAQRLYKDSKNFNSILSYSVTYLMLDKYPAVDITGTYAENEKALLLDTVKTLQENTTRISVLESKKAEKDAPAWITPTLLNGASQYVDYQKVGYIKDGFGIVHLRGLIATAPANSRIFILPAKYRPAYQLIFRVAGAGESYEIRITADGSVFTTNTGNYISLDGITFQAEQ